MVGSPLHLAMETFMPTTLKRVAVLYLFKFDQLFKLRDISIFAAIKWA